MLVSLLTYIFIFCELSLFILLRFAICSVVVELVEEKSCGGCGLDNTKYSNTYNECETRTSCYFPIQKNSYLCQYVIQILLR